MGRNMDGAEVGWRDGLGYAREGPTGKAPGKVVWCRIDCCVCATNRLQEIREDRIRARASLKVSNRHMPYQRPYARAKARKNHAPDPHKTGLNGMMPEGIMP